MFDTVSPILAGLGPALAGAVRGVQRGLAVLLAGVGVWLVILGAVG